MSKQICFTCNKNVICHIFKKTELISNELATWVFAKAGSHGGIIERDEEWKEQWDKVDKDLHEAIGRHCPFYEEDKNEL